MDPEATRAAERVLRRWACVVVTHSAEQHGRLATQTLTLNHPDRSSEVHDTVP